MAGSTKPRPSQPASVNVVGKCSRLTPAATSPGPAAASAASAACAAPPAASAAAASTPSATPATSAGPCNLFTEPGGSGVFFVEHIERRQADVGDFLFTESDFVT